MKAYKTPYTEKFPFQYTVEVDGYIVHTTKQENWEKLQAQIMEKRLTTFDKAMLLKLEIAGFTIKTTL